MRKLKLLTAICSLILGTVASWAQASYNINYTEGVTVAEGSDYFLYNIGAKMFLTDGMDYGTHASVDHAGRVITLATNNNGFSIYTRPYSANGSAEKAGYMTLNGYVDTGKNDADWVFTPVELDGYANVYTIKNSDTQYLYYEVKDGLYNGKMGAFVNVGNNTDDVASYWLLIPMSARQSVNDYTYLLRNTDFHHPWELVMWSNTVDWTNTAGGKKENVCAEMYGKGFDISQTISATIANGKYILYNQAFYNNADASNKTYLYANSDQAEVAILNANDEGTAANMAGASDAFIAGQYVNEVTTIVTNGSLKVGLKNATSAGNAWSIMDNFFLKYLGTTLINDAVALPNDGAMEADTWYYFDITVDSKYNLTATTLNDIVYVTDGEALTSEANNADTHFAGATNQDLTEGRYYIKSSSANNLVVTVAEYVYSLGDVTMNLSNNQYIDIAGFTTFTMTYSNAATNNPDASFGLLNNSAKAILKKDGSSVAEGTLSLEGKTLTATFDYEMALNSSYTLSVEAGVVGYEGHATNEAIELTLNTGVVANGVYYFKRNGTETYLTRGGNYGTENVTDKFGISIELSLRSDGTYTFKNVDQSLVSNGTRFVKEGYTDQEGGYNWTIEATEGGYLLRRANGSYVTTAEQETYHYNYMTNAADAASAIVWTLLTKEEYAAGLVARKNAEIAAIATVASLENAANEADMAANFGWEDMTSSITNPTMYDNNDGWTGFACNPQRQKTDPTEIGRNIIPEVWNYIGGAKQTISNLPEGVYRLTVKAIWRIGDATQAGRAGAEANVTAWMFAESNGVTDYTQLKSWYNGQPANTTAIKNSTTEYLNTVYVYVAEGQDLTIGIVQPSWCGIPWMPFCDWTLAKLNARVYVSGVELNQTSATLNIGDAITLVPTITPAEAEDKTIEWSSSDESVATVSEDGFVSALNAGTATITATAKDTNGAEVKATCTITVNSVPAAPAYHSEIAAGDFYIVNAATGKFLGGANSWGTQASLIEHGIPFTATLADGKYTLDSHTYNNADYHFLNGTYVDGASTPLYIIALGDGKYSISTAENANFLTVQPGTTTVANNANSLNSTLAQWYFLSKNDRDKMLAAATAENPVDATYYVKQANISRNLSAGAYNENAWSQYEVGGTQDNTNYVAQVFDAVVDNYQLIENIPNGTYTVSVQAFTSGTDVKFYANDQEVDVKNNDSGASSCSDAAALFAQGLYPNTVTVTVTDRTLKIGFEGDCSSAKWLCYDKVEMYMTGYTANTGITAEIDNSEIEVGETAQITAATVPADASFNAITYSSSDEAIATVDENGVVTGVGVGTATITVAAIEMESFTETVDVTVKATTPTALELSETEVKLDATISTATLTVIPTPDNANTSVTWTSSDETVATVADGVVTGVSTGTAIITATSTLDENVTATATVTVTFPESTVPSTIIANEGATRKICTLGANIIKNGSFEYPNAVYGWTTGTGSVNAMVASNFNIPTEGAADGNQYLQATASQGGAHEKSINTSWPLEDGKTYVFSYMIKANKECTTNLGYIGVSLSNTKGSENANKKFETPAYGTEWKEVSYTFTNDDNYKFLVFNARWMANAQSFDNFYLAEAAYTIEGNVDYATAAIPTANIGDGVFQYSQSAIDAANALVQGEATVADVEAAYEALTTLNAPDANQEYNLVVATAGHAKEGNAVIIVPGTSGANNPTGYGLNANFAVNANLNQAVTFTKVSGNNYNISFETAEGTTYLTYGSLNGSAAGWKNSQIQATADASKKGEFMIAATETDNVFNIYNTVTNSTIACQSGGNIYTEAGNADFTVTVAEKPSIAINTMAAGWGTTILPFAVNELPEGVKAYTCGDADSDGLLTLVEVTAFEANKPYIIEGAWNETLTGDAQGAALNYTDGLLTGTYENIDAPDGKYIMQMQNNRVGFYHVDYAYLEENEMAKPKVKANRAYLTAPDGAEGARAFFFDGGETTGISAIEALANGDAQIFNVNGVQQPRLMKGLNIIVTKDGKTHKVMVK